MTKLLPGDRVSFIQNGRRLRGVIADALQIKVRGEELELPVVRPSRRSASRPLMEQQRPPKLRWIKRSLLRKLPVKKEGGKEQQ
ncbi:hypothetical protein EBT31_23395 [bacterium]|jgi:hypothetical protein|nr:hypothetical protein [bacterium]